MARQMDVYLQRQVDPERFEFYRNVCVFADRSVAPKLNAWERERRLLDDETLAAMAELGLFGITSGERYGGANGQQIDVVLMGLALGYHSHSVAITPGAAVSLGIKPLLLAGSDAQKQAHLRDLAQGKRMFVFGLSEPGRGSDAANPQVAAVRTKSGWRIRGEKCWSTNAKWASHAIVHALTNPKGAPGHRSTCFIVPKDHPRVAYREVDGKNAWRLSSTGSLIFDDVEVGEDAVLGGINEGFKIMASTLNGGRLYIAALALASIAFALDKARTYVQERQQFGDQPIGRFQRVQDVIIEMDIALEQGLSWLVSLVRQFDAGTMPRESAAKIKIECSRRASELLPLAMEICGGIACMQEFGLSRHNEDLFVARVGEGSNFALKTLIAKSLMPDIRQLLQ